MNIQTGLLNRICKDFNIQLIENKNIKDGCIRLKNGEGGKAIKLGERYVIIFDENMQPFEKKHTVAHELGHIMLGHFLRTDDNLDTEAEANIYAAVLTALDTYGEYVYRDTLQGNENEIAHNLCTAIKTATTAV